MLFQTNLMLKMQKTISKETYTTIYENLINKPGIIEVLSDLALPYLMMVDYDSSKVSSQSILSVAKQNDEDAKIIGM